MSVPVLTVPEHKVGSLREYIYSAAANKRVASYGPHRIDMGLVAARASHLARSEAELHQSSRFFLAAFKFAQWVHDNPDVLSSEFLRVLPPDSGGEFVLRKFGLAVPFTRRGLGDFALARVNAFEQMLEPHAIKLSDDSLHAWMSSNRLWFELHDHRLHDSYSSDESLPMLQRAVWTARRKALTGMSFYSSDLHTRESGGVFFSSYGVFDGLLSVDQFIDAYSLVYTLSQPLSRELLIESRALLLRERTRAVNAMAVQRKQIAAENFSKYWERVKSAVRAVQLPESLAHEQWSTIPILPEGTKSSRTWGIEIETVHADRVERPPGWDETSDGSLEIDCQCDTDDCNNCYDGYHEDCDYCSSSCAEFVSPVLSHYNSSGLRSITNSLDTYESNETPGIHVHVGAEDLTVTDVARLLAAYSAIEPLITPLYHRHTRGYCNPMSSNNVRFWLSQARDYERANGHLPSTARELAFSQPDSRYQDVNTQALSKHGTIEFRAMGAYYDYDHLVRWAWFVREMVNVSRLGLSLSTWTACRSILDVIAVLRKHGSEMPLDSDIDRMVSDSLYEE